ncbi:hypothetical protein BC834DRAFT_785204, partial [Gloeopeniophorella convolvens]
LTVRWTAGHSGIEGNKQVDEDAKLAAAGLTSNKKDLPAPLHKLFPRSASAIKQAANDAIKVKWKQKWAKSPRYDQYKKL